VVLRVRLKTVPIQQWSVGREFRRRIKLAFEARGIDFPSGPTVRLKRSRPTNVEALPAAEKV
jgi:small-conductance mechanosensitive channel